MREIKDKELTLGSGKYLSVTYINCKFTDNTHSIFKDCTFVNCKFKNNQHVEFVKCNLDKRCTIC